MGMEEVTEAALGEDAMDEVGCAKVAEAAWACMLLSSEEAMAVCFCCACCCWSAADMFDADGTDATEGYEDEGEANSVGEELREEKVTDEGPEWAGTCMGEE